MSPAAYAGQNPLRYRDPDGRTIIEGLKPEVSDDEKLEIAAYQVAQEVLNELGSSVQDVQDACNVQARLEIGNSRGEPGLADGYGPLNYLPGFEKANQIWDAADHYIGGKRAQTADDPMAGLMAAAANPSSIPGPSAPKAPDGLTIKAPSGGKSVGQQQGREMREEKLREYEFDKKQPAHVRGWLKQERDRVDSGRATDTRTPPGYVQAHGRTTPAREGFDYSNSRLQGVDLNKLEERVRRRNQ
jgi:hypothetical protein